MNKAVKIIIATVIVVLCASSLYVTEADEYSVITQFGEIKNIRTEAGLGFKIPLIQNVKKIYKNERLYDIAISDVITRDKKTMVIDCFVLWSVIDSEKYMSTVNANTLIAQSRIDAVVYNAIKSEISKTNQIEVINSRDGGLTREIMNNVGDSFERYGINLINIEIKMLDLPENNENAVYERMISERNNIAASYTAQGNSEAKIIRNQADADAQVLLSEAKATSQELIASGESTFMSILSDAYDSPEKADFYEFIISLDTAKATMGNGQTDNILIVDGDSDIAKMFNK
jgi:membrane protease subunit HflC